jgi:hypothetical protein
MFHLLEKLKGVGRIVINVPFSYWRCGEGVSEFQTVHG